MAELVQKSLESTLPELEELERVGIFSKDEIRTVVKRRRRLEYRLLRRPARLADYLRAIQYEVNLDLLRRHRKKTHGVTDRVHEAERGITSRLHLLFQRALRKFKGNIRLWLQYIEFCKRVHHHQSLSKIYGKMLAFHPHNSALWVMAAKDQLEVDRNPAAARTLLQRGIRGNQQCSHLWLEYFKMELLHVDQMVKRRSVLGVDMATADDDESQTVNDTFMTNETAAVVYRTAVATIPDDIQFRLSFLPIAKLFSNTKDLCEKIWASIEGDFPDDPSMWDALARRPWNDCSNAEELSEEELMELELRSVAVYREGVARLASADMQDRMVHWCVERVEKMSPRASVRRQELVTQRLVDTLQTAADHNCLTLDSSKLYVRVLLDTGRSELALHFSELASRQHPGCVELWQWSLSSPTATEHEKQKILESAVKTSPNEMSLLSVWRQYVTWTITTHQDPSVVTALFERAIASMTGQSKAHLLEMYFDWLLVTKGIDDVRQAYLKILSSKPVPLSLCYHFINTEENQTRVDMKRLRFLYEAALSDHSSTEIRLWLGYLRCETTLPGGQLASVGGIYWRALKRLSPDLVNCFITRHTLQQRQLNSADIALSSP